MDRTVIEQALQRAQTPFYLFNTDLTKGKLAFLKSRLGPDVQLCFAMKANPFLVGAIANAADYFEVCSPGELRICMRRKIPAEKLVLSGVYKAKQDVQAMLEYCAGAGVYTVESVAQWEQLCLLAAAGRTTVHALLRLTNGSQFGLDKEEILQLVQAGEKTGYVSVEGIQFFAGTQRKAVTRMQEDLQMLDDFLQQLHRDAGFTARKLEYGPGFPVDYFGENQVLEDAVTKALAGAIAQLRFKGRIVLELGREIAACCGSYVTKVVDVKRREQQRFCIVDGGIHQLNYYGQMMGMKTPPVVHWENSAGQPEDWSVFGSLCTMNDVLLKNHPFVGLKTGSHLVFGQAGAYSVTEGMALFLSRDLPQVWLYSKDGGLQLARKQTHTDVFNSENTQD